MKKLFFVLASAILVSCGDGSPVEEKTTTYNDCKVIKLEHTQDYTNFNWNNSITFINENGDTITGYMTNDDICKLHEDLKNGKDSVTLHTSSGDYRIVY